MNTLLLVISTLTQSTVQCKGFSDQYCGQKGGYLVMELVPYSRVDTHEQHGNYGLSVRSIFCALVLQESSSRRVQSVLYLLSAHMQVFPVDILPDDKLNYERMDPGKLLDVPSPEVTINNKTPTTEDKTPQFREPLDKFPTSSNTKTTHRGGNNHDISMPMGAQHLPVAVRVN